MTINPTPLHRPEPTSTFDKLGLNSPYQITKYLVNFLQNKFSDISNITDPALKTVDYVWRPDVPTDTAAKSNNTPGIVITTNYGFNPQIADNRPNLVVCRGNFTKMPDMVIGSKYHTPTFLLGQHDPNYQPTLGNNQYMHLVQGTHTIKCVHLEGAACEVLSFEVWRTLLDFFAVIRRDLGLHALEITELPAPTQSDDYKPRKWVNSITINYIYYLSNILDIESPILKAIDIEKP